jgi:hypothetical protein
LDNLCPAFLSLCAIDALSFSSKFQFFSLIFHPSFPGSFYNSINEKDLGNTTSIAKSFQNNIPIIQKEDVKCKRKKFLQLLQAACS